MKEVITLRMILNYKYPNGRKLRSRKNINFPKKKKKSFDKNSSTFSIKYTKQAKHSSY